MNRLHAEALLALMAEMYIIISTPDPEPQPQPEPAGNGVVSMQHMPDPYEAAKK